MTSLQFLDSIITWLLADPAHVITAAAAIAALTPTPDPGTVAGKLYRIVDILALNVLRAKETGAAITPAAAPVQSSPAAQQKA